MENIDCFQDYINFIEETAARHWNNFYMNADTFVKHAAHKLRQMDIVVFRWIHIFAERFC